MIKANELRIGVNIQEKIYSSCGVHLVVREVTEDLLEVLFAARNYDDFGGIPLTPEILEQCGFNQSINHHLDYYIDTGVGNNVFCLRIDRPFKHEGNWWLEVKYLHQLQNLYSSITGRELKLNHTALSPLH